MDESVSLDESQHLVFQKGNCSEGAMTRKAECGNQGTEATQVPEGFSARGNVESSAECRAWWFIRSFCAAMVTLVR